MACLKLFPCCGATSTACELNGELQPVSSAANQGDRLQGHAAVQTVDALPASYPAAESSTQVQSDGRILSHLHGVDVWARAVQWRPWAPVPENEDGGSEVGLRQLLCEVHLKYPPCGTGASGGRVFKALWHGSTVAVKLLVSNSADTLNLATREAMLCRMMSHPNLVQCYSVCVTRLSPEDLQPETYVQQRQRLALQGGGGGGTLLSDGNSLLSATQSTATTRFTNSLYYIGGTTGTGAGTGTGNGVTGYGYDGGGTNMSLVSNGNGNHGTAGFANRTGSRGSTCHNPASQAGRASASTGNNGGAANCCGSTRCNHPILHVSGAPKPSSNRSIVCDNMAGGAGSLDKAAAAVTESVAKAEAPADSEKGSACTDLPAARGPEACLDTVAAAATTVAGCGSREGAAAATAAAAKCGSNGSGSALAAPAAAAAATAAVVLAHPDACPNLQLHPSTPTKSAFPGPAPLAAPALDLALNTDPATPGLWQSAHSSGAGRGTARGTAGSHGHGTLLQGGSYSCPVAAVVFGGRRVLTPGSYSGATGRRSPAALLRSRLSVLRTLVFGGRRSGTAGNGGGSGNNSGGGDCEGNGADYDNFQVSCTGAGSGGVTSAGRDAGGQGLTPHMVVALSLQGGDCKAGGGGAAAATGSPDRTPAGKSPLAIAAGKCADGWRVESDSGGDGGGSVSGRGSDGGSGSENDCSSSVRSAVEAPARGLEGAPEPAAAAQPAEAPAAGEHAVATDAAAHVGSASTALKPNLATTVSARRPGLMPGPADAAIASAADSSDSAADTELTLSGNVASLTCDAGSGGVATAAAALLEAPVPLPASQQQQQQNQQQQQQQNQPGVTLEPCRSAGVLEQQRSPLELGQQQSCQGQGWKLHRRVSSSLSDTEGGSKKRTISPGRGKELSSSCSHGSAATASPAPAAAGPGPAAAAGAAVAGPTDCTMERARDTFGNVRPLPRRQMTGRTLPSCIEDPEAQSGPVRASVGRSQSFVATRGTQADGRGPMPLPSQGLALESQAQRLQQNALPLHEQQQRQQQQQPIGGLTGPHMATNIRGEPCAAGVTMHGAAGSPAHYPGIARTSANTLHGRPAGRSGSVHGHQAPFGPHASRAGATTAGASCPGSSPLGSMASLGGPLIGGGTGGGATCGLESVDYNSAFSFGNLEQVARVLDDLRGMGAAPGRHVTAVLMEFCDRGTLLDLVQANNPPTRPVAPRRSLVPRVAAMNSRFQHQQQQPSAASGGSYCSGGGGGSGGQGLDAGRSGRWQTYDILYNALEVAQGMAYLHSLNLVHGDLKPANILVKNCADGTTSRGYTCKISDFGLTNAVTANPKAVQEQVQTSTDWGALAYMAPEVPMGRPGKPADVYSYGALLWHMATGMQPHHDLHPARLLVGLASGELKLEWPHGVNPTIRRIGEACMVREPQQRPKFDTIVRTLLKAVRRAAKTSRADGGAGVSRGRGLAAPPAAAPGEEDRRVGSHTGGQDARPATPAASAVPSPFNMPLPSNSLADRRPLSLAAAVMAAAAEEPLVVATGSCSSSGTCTAATDTRLGSGPGVGPRGEAESERSVA